MKKKINKLLLPIITLVLILLLPRHVYAINDNSVFPSKLEEYSSKSYVIDKYDVNIDVNEDNSYDITETITAYFNVPKHGIYKYIPLRNTVRRLDGTSSTNRVRITNLTVNNSYTTSRENNKYIIRIGSKNTTLTGSNTYQIKYRYHLGKDPLSDKDELYLNIIGADWDTVIGNITFSINMPKDFDVSKLGFSSGKVGSTDNNITYTVENNTIKGSYNGILPVNSAVTVRCELDEGYFTFDGNKITSSDYLIIVIPIISLLISLCLWYIFGRDNPVIETVEFYPPVEFNSLEVGFYYNGKANTKDVTSLLIYLANKGYIKITEVEGKGIKKNDFRITKLKDYDGNNENERIFLNGLFKHSNSKGEVTSKNLEDSFYKTMNKILTNINSKKNKNEIFDKSTRGKKVIIVLLMIISLITIIAVPTSYIGSPDILMFLVLFAIYIPLIVGGLVGKMPILVKIFWLGFTLLHMSFMIGFFPIKEIYDIKPIYVYFTLIGFICILGMGVCLKYMPKRTEYGNQILGKLRGFRNYLKTAEKDRLEAMVTQNPSYFYDILPYAYVLGVSDKWIKKFETISIQKAEWYDSNSNFDINTFGTFMNRAMSTAQSSMSSSPSTSSSSSSSGGGFSGGGSGGGGGGSW